MRTHIVLATVTLAAAVALPAVAHGRPIRYAGGHPVAARHGGGYCHLDTPHLHAYAPDRAALYQQAGDHYVFTGDPTPFGYDGDKHVYYGHHPLVSVPFDEPVYCYLNGPHHHADAPGDLPGFKLKGGVAFYVGPFAPSYQPARAKVVNAEYRPHLALRPHVEVAPPPEWRGEVYVAAPSVTVRPPQVAVVAPPPPRVVVHAPAPPVVVAPPPRVVVHAPAPPRVTVHAPAPHVVVGPPRGHVVVGGPSFHGGVHVGGRVKVKHDRGRHKGWYR